MSSSAQIWSAISWMPWAIPILFTAASLGRDEEERRWGKQIMLLLWGTWLMVVYAILYFMQLHLDVQRPDPFDPASIYYAFPSMFVFYLTSSVGFVVGFCYIWNIELHWSYWCLLFVLSFAPPFMSWWIQFNLFYELLVSFLVGLSAAVVFLLLYFIHVAPKTPYLLALWPFSWVPCIDTFIMGRADRLKAQYVRLTLLKYGGF